MPEQESFMKDHILLYFGDFDGPVNSGADPG
jgi:hypothetical protein